MNNFGTDQKALYSFYLNTNFSATQYIKREKTQANSIYPMYNLKPPGGEYKTLNNNNISNSYFSLSELY